MRTQIARVIANAIDQRRFAAAQELIAEEIGARCILNNTAIVACTALAVEDGQVEPGIIRVVACRPDDRIDLAACQVHAERRRFLNRCQRHTVRRLDLAIEPRPPTHR